MVSAFIVPADALIKRLAVELRENDIITPPEWAQWVKTAHFKEDKPIQDDWFYLRAGSILRKIYMRGPVGVQELRKLYGSAKNRGSNPEKASLSSGAIIRTIIHQLEQKGLIELNENQGRQISSKGTAFVDGVSKSIKSEIPELQAYI